MPRPSPVPRILEAARQLFLEKGFEGASTEAVAVAARTSKETLYRHFSTKESLLVAVVREAAAQARVLEASTEEPIDSDAQLSEVLTRHVDAALTLMLSPDYIALMRLVIAENGRHPELGDLFRTSVVARGSGVVRTYLESAREHNLIRPDVDVDSAVRMLAGAVVARGVAVGLLGTGDPIQAPSGWASSLVEIFLHGVST